MKDLEFELAVSINEKIRLAEKRVKFWDTHNPAVFMSMEVTLRPSQKLQKKICGDIVKEANKEIAALKVTFEKL